LERDFFDFEKVEGEEEGAVLIVVVEASLSDDSNSTGIGR